MKTLNTHTHTHTPKHSLTHWGKKKKPAPPPTTEGVRILTCLPLFLSFPFVGYSTHTSLVPGWTPFLFVAS